MANRGGYWWECQNCHKEIDFSLDFCGATGIPTFITNVLRPSVWDQSHLLKICPNCNKNTVKVTYFLSKKEDETTKVFVDHLVGVEEQGNPKFVKMMWEGFFSDWGSDENYFDFKYQHNNEVKGLSHPGPFTKSELKKLFALYCEKTNKKTFP